MVKLLRYLFFALIVAVLAVGFKAVPRANYETDLMALVPPGADAAEIAKANQLLSEAIVERASFLLSSSDWDATQEAASVFMDRLYQCDCIERVSSAPDGATFTELGNLYLQYAPVLLSQKDRVLLQQGQTEAMLKSALRELSLRSAESPLLPNGVASGGEEPDAPPNPETRNQEPAPPATIPALARDPLTTASDFVEALRQQALGEGQVENGLLYYPHDNTERRYVLVTADLARSPHSLSTQLAAGRVIDKAKEDFRRSVPDPTIIEMGDLFSARAVLEQSRWELIIIASGTLLGTIVVLLLVLRSVWLSLLALLPVSVGAATGLVATVLIFGGVHLVALMVGITLVGVSIDYSLHFLCRRRAMGAGWEPELALKRLFPGLTLGLLTSSAGYLGFVVTGLEALQQIAVFASAGLLAAYLMVVGLYPMLLDKPDERRQPYTLQDRITRYLAVSRDQLRRLKHPEIFLPLAALAAVSIWQLEPLDDVGAMQPPNLGVEQEEARFRQIADGMASAEYLIVRAGDQESLLQKLEQLQGPLRQLQNERVMQGYVNLSEWVPSAATQQTNNRLLNEQLIASGLLERYLDQLGVPPERQQALRQAFADADGRWLTINQVAPLLENLLDRPLYFTHGDKHYSLVLFDGLRDFRPLQGLAASNANVMWVDRELSASRLISDYRQRITWVLAGAYLVTLLLLLVRYGWQAALLVLAPPFVASALMLMILAWIGLGFTLFTVLAMILILGIGIDYALFLRENRGQDCGSFVAIIMSAATTIVAFGLLMLSATPAIVGFGLTVCLGIGLALLLTPLAMGRDNPRNRSGAPCR